jgi:hypothetical protein
MAFDIYERLFDEDGEYEEEATFRYRDELMELFVASPEGQELVRQRGVVAGWADMFMDYGMRYLRRTPPEMSLDEVEEVLFDLFPRKVSADPESGEEIVHELHAFWTFLQREFHVANADACLRLLTPATGRRLEKEMQNPHNFDMAKSLVMSGKARGFDMTTPEGMDAWIKTYNMELLAARTAREADAGPPLPVPGAFWPDAHLPGTHSHRATKAQAARRKMARDSRRKNRKRK